MKKAIVLLLALAVLGGAVFAQEPSVSADATLTWGFDLNTNATGFLNEYSADVTIPFAVGDAEATGEGTYGYISLSNITFELFNDPTTGAATLGFNDIDGDDDPASLEAKIISGPLYVMVYNFSDLDFNKAEALLDGEVEATFDANTAGTEIGYDSDMIDVAFILNSKGDWTTNLDNEYGIGLVASFVAVEDLLTINAGFSYDVKEVSKDMGAYVTLPVTLGMLSITPAFDLWMPEVGDMAFDARVDFSYDLTETTNASLAVYYGGDEDLELSVDFEEDGGFVPNLFLGFGFGYYNALETAVTATYDAYADLEYTVTLEGDNYLMPYAYMTVGIAAPLTLQVGVEAMLIPNTTFTLDYTSTDVGGVDKGIITFATNVSL